jgi:hypothetical protein
MAAKLRAVAADEKPVKVEPRVLTVTKAASEGTARELLMSLRERVAKDVENPNTPARDLAALTLRLMAIVKEIEALDARELEESDGSAATPDAAWEAV